MPTWLAIPVAAVAAAACAVLCVRCSMWFRRVRNAPPDDPAWEHPAARDYELSVAALLTIILAIAVLVLPAIILAS